MTVLRGVGKRRECGGITMRRWRFLVPALTIFCGLWMSVASYAQQAAKPDLSESELKGKKLFLQRCSICHMPPLYEPPSARPYGPMLEGYLKTPQLETRAREAILKGGPRMPGFQYGLEPAEIDNIIAYMKTTKAVSKEGGKSSGSQGAVGD